MKRILEIRPVARREFDEASDWYLHEEGPELRDQFVSAIDKTLRDITIQPLRFPEVFAGSTRRAVVARFPYSIFFRGTEASIIVLAVFHDSRDPVIWKGRIG